MAVSFVSKALTNNPYISNINQDILFKSMLHKQQNFNQGVQQTDQLLKTLDEQRILNPEHNAYYQEKLNQLTDSINELGDSDFSDRTTMQTIGGLSQRVTKDIRIQSAIDDTTKIRKAQATIELWKTDPKKYKGMYSIQNEEFLKNSIGSYINDKTPTAKFNGAAIPFYDYNDILGKEIKSVQDQIIKTKGYTTTDGKYIRTENGLSAIEIRKIAQNRLESDPQISQQVSIDAWYKYRGTPETTSEFQQYRVQQLMGAKEVFDKQASAQNDANMLDMLHGTRQEIEAKKAKAREQLAFIKQTRDNYDQQIQAAGTLSREQQIQALHKEHVLAGLQSKYQFQSRELKADPIYNYDLMHKDREAALAFKREESDIQFTRDLQMNKLEFEQQLKLKEMDVAKTTGLKKQAYGGYATDPNNLVTTTIGAMGLPTEGLEDYQASYNTLKEAQVKLVEDVAVNFMAAGNLDTAAKVRALIKGKFKPEFDANGKMIKINHPTLAGNSLAPKMAEAVSFMVKNHQRLLNGEPLEESVARQLDSKTKESIGQMSYNMALMGVKANELNGIIDTAVKASGMTPQELKERNRLAALQKTNPDKFTGQVGYGGGYIESEEQRLLAKLNSKYEKAIEPVKAKINQLAEYRKGYTVFGDALKEDGQLQAIIKGRIAQQALSLPGATNAQLRSELAELNVAKITGVRIIPDTQQLIVRGERKDGDKGNPLVKEYTLDFAGTEEWKGVLDQQLQAEHVAGYRELQKQLDTKGKIERAKDTSLQFHTNKSKLNLGITLYKDLNTQEYEVGYLYDNQQHRLPLRLSNNTPFLPNAFSQNPVQWSKTQLDSWVDTHVIPILKRQYELENPNKPLSGFKPTIQDFHRFIQRNY